MRHGTWAGTRVGLRLAAAVTVAGLLAGCGGSPLSAAGPGGPTSGGGASAGGASAGGAQQGSAADGATPAGPATLAATTFAPPGRAAAVLAATGDKGLADFVAKTTSTVQVLDGYTFVVKDAFPNGASAEVTYRLSAGNGKPAGKAVAKGDQYTFEYRYPIDAATLPPQVRSQLVAGPPTAAAAAPTAGGAAPAARIQAVDLTPYVPPVDPNAPQEPGTIEVVETGVLKQAVEVGLERHWHAAGLGHTHFVDALANAAKLWEAWESNAEIQEALHKLEELRRCAEDPTNPLTIERYEKDPGAKQKVLDELDRIRRDIDLNATVLILGLINEFGTQFVEKLIKPFTFLGYVVKAGTEYATKTLVSLINEGVREAEALVPKCYKWTASGGSPGVTVSGEVTNFSKPFTLQVTSPQATGTVTLTPNGRNPRSGTLTGRSALSYGIEVSTGSYQLTQTPSGFDGVGPVKTCLELPGYRTCSPTETFHITFTQHE